ncbi:hypothetical protein HNP89_001463 [Methanococcus maripaludis]|uniref:Uncharacterized protein n=1 Tax=Methanococcus maripaludis TaxID=39152 RepID=A0A7J9P1N8_METMI|nr:hypothetical protein [Methanococcus maripaludis]MBA2853487.1 hypothetical protein [Methanococcus maripaludis]
MEFKKNLTDLITIILRNWFSAILSLILAISSFFYINTILENIWAILGIYATILSILISATYISAQVAISGFGSKVWKNYSDDGYIKFYVYLFPSIFILGAILGILDFEYPNLTMNINNLFILEFFKKNIIDYGLSGFFLGIFTFFITFSLFNVPNYLKHVMEILNPTNIILNALKQISTSKNYGENEKKIVEYIEATFKELNRKEQYDTILDCLKLLYGEEFKIISDTKLNNFKEFSHDYNILLYKIYLMEYPENYEIAIKISIISGFETIYKCLCNKNNNAHISIKHICDITCDAVEKYDPNGRLNYTDHYLSEIRFNEIISKTLESFQDLKLYSFEKTNSNIVKNNLKSIFTYSITLSRAFISKWVKFYPKLDKTGIRQYILKSNWINHIIEMINEDTFKIIEESKTEKEVEYLIEYLTEFYKKLILTKDFDYKIDSDYLFEIEHRLIATSLCKLINLLESKKYIGSLDSVLRDVINIEDKSTYILHIFSEKSCFYHEERKTGLNNLKLIKLMRKFIKNTEENQYLLLIVIWEWDITLKNFLENGPQNINLNDLDKLCSDDYFGKWIAENKYENRVDEIKNILSNSK